ncbi:hypothetical protein TNCV_2340681 [Trichonephila clavipes]|nr:hypothetical protein TNCV_2340681 [Trichonephila clavipes]
MPYEMCSTKPSWKPGDELAAAPPSASRKQQRTGAGKTIYSPCRSESQNRKKQISSLGREYAAVPPFASHKQQRMGIKALKVWPEPGFLSS